MVSGNLALLSQGGEEVYLVGNPQKTYFKSVYMQHTRFAMNKLLAANHQRCLFGRKTRFVINRSGDLLKDIFLELKVPPLDQTQEGAEYVGYVNNFMASCIRRIDIYIGEQLIDRITGGWIDIYNELFTGTKRETHDVLVGKSLSDLYPRFNALDSPSTFILPIPFWFSENIGHALPLIALQHNEIYVDIYFQKAKGLALSDVSLRNILDTDGNPFEIMECDLYGTYINLDKAERKLFAFRPHEYLITQHRLTSYVLSDINSLTPKLRLDLKLPVKAIYWVLRDEVEFDTLNGNNWTEYSLDGQVGIMDTANITVNGQKYVEESSSKYYNQYVPYMLMNNGPRTFIYSYSFALDACSWKPSGYLNFSKVNNAYLNMTINPVDSIKEVLIYSQNFNVLRIASGIGGLAFH